MKPSIQFILTLATSMMLATAARARPETVYIIDMVPVEMQTACYRKVPDSNYYMVILSSECSFWTIGAGSYKASTVFRFNEPLPGSSRSLLEWRLTTAVDTGVWQALGSGILAKDRLFLGKVQLQPGEYCELLFREMRSGKVIQRLVVQRILAAPGYKNFRQYAPGQDAGEEMALSKKLEKAAIPLQPGNVMRLQPGMVTDILLEDGGFNADSSLEYSFEPIENATVDNWKPTGTLLHLEPLPGAANYILQVRYQGIYDTRNIVLATAPYWYQHILFKILLALLLAALLLGVPWYIYRYRSRKEKWHRSRLEHELLLVHNQLNPHFIFNSLSSINSLIVSGENKRAAEYLSVFSDMMRHTMSVSDKVAISLAEDLDQMEQYLRIEQLRFQFRYEIDVSQDLNINAIELPPQLLQPSLENAVKHGASGLQAAGDVKLQIYAKNDDLYIRILNNSRVGFRRPDKGQGKGLKFTNDQMGYLQQLYREREIRFDLQVADDGAAATFFFENWLKPEQ